MTARSKNIITYLLLFITGLLCMIAFLTGYQDGTPLANALGMASRYLILINFVILEIVGREKK